MHDKIPLTIYIRTHNEECRIGPVVKRALSTGAEVIVVDDGSIDRTQIIAREAGAIVFENKWEGGGKQKRFAEKMASNKWLLDLDADEILSHELVEELKKIFSNPPKPGLYKINSFGYDFQILAANYFDDIVFGGGWAGNIKNAGFKGELSYFIDKENIKNSLSFSTSIDYSTKNGFYFLGSYLYNSNGQNESNFLSLININANVLSPKNLMPSKHSYLFQISKPITPPLNSSLNILYGQGIKLLYISPTFSYDINSRLDAGIISQFFFLDNFGDFISL